MVFSTRLFQRRNFEICFSNSSTWMKKKTKKQKSHRTKQIFPTNWPTIDDFEFVGSLITKSSSSSDMEEQLWWRFLSSLLLFRDLVNSPSKIFVSFIIFVCISIQDFVVFWSFQRKSGNKSSLHRVDVCVKCLVLEWKISKGIFRTSMKIVWSRNTKIKNKCLRQFQNFLSYRKRENGRKLLGVKKKSLSTYKMQNLSFSEATKASCLMTRHFESNYLTSLDRMRKCYPNPSRNTLLASSCYVISSFDSRTRSD